MLERHAMKLVHCQLVAGAPRRLADPRAAGVESSRALVSAFGETRSARSPEAAADMLLNAANKLLG